jgi:type I restriction enzyme, S subunit
VTRQQVLLGDALTELIDYRGKTPKKLGGDWSLSGHRVVSAKNIKDSRVDDNDHHYVDSDIYEKWMKVPLQAGDVLLTSEAPTGEVAYLSADQDWVLGQRLFGLRADPEKLVGEYLFYLLRGGPTRQQLLARATGTTVSGIRQSQLVKVVLDLPPLDEQRAVAATLGSLDAKIESNRLAVGLIDELLKALFHEAVSDLETSLQPVSEFASVTKGVSYKSVDLVESRTSLVTLKSFDRTGGYKPQGLKQYAGPYKPQQVIAPGELAVAQTDLTQAAEVVGRAIRIPSDRSADVLVASLDLAIVRPLHGMSQAYLWGVLTQEAFREHCRARTSGTTVLHLASGAVGSYMAPVATQERQEAFSEVAEPLLLRADALNQESESLAQLRETLLPALLSGRVGVAVEASA